MSKNKKIILTAILLAMLIILSRFLSIKTPITKISFAFIPTMLCAVWLGPKWTVLLNVLGDVIGATLFPTGPYFIGYTISTAIAGFIYVSRSKKKCFIPIPPITDENNTNPGNNGDKNDPDESSAE